MGVIIDDPLPLGHKIDLDLLLPDSSDDDKQESSNSITIEGEVVWTKYSESLDKHQIGIKFTDLNAHSKERLKSFIDKYTQDNS
jgi:c-di-GMP-binding flagellar brake protein YcgR